MKKFIGKYLLPNLIIFLPFLLWGHIKTSGADFLKSETLPNASGMAGSFVGVRSNIEAIEYNTANIAELKFTELKTAYSLSLFEVTIGNLLFITPIKYGVFGIDTSFVSYPEVQRYGMWGENIENISGIYEGFISLNYGLRILKTENYSFNWGFGTQYTRRSIWKFERNFFSLNIGWNFFIKFPQKYIKDSGVNLGLTMKNIQPFLVKKPVESNETYLPILYCIGISLNLKKSFLLNLDYRYFQNINYIIKTGMEYSYNLNYFTIKGRTGIEFRPYNVRYSGGLGIEYQFEKFVLIFDYGINYYKELFNTVHNIGLGIRFSKLEIRIDLDQMYYKGLYHFVNEEYDKAEEYFNKILSIDSNYVKAKDRLNEIKKIREFMREREKYESEYIKIKEYFKNKE